MAREISVGGTELLIDSPEMQGQLWASLSPIDESLQTQEGYASGPLPLPMWPEDEIPQCEIRRLAGQKVGDQNAAAGAWEVGIAGEERRYRFKVTSLLDRVPDTALEGESGAKPYLEVVIADDTQPEGWRPVDDDGAKLLRQTLRAMRLALPPPRAQENDRPGRIKKAISALWHFATHDVER